MKKQMNKPTAIVSFSDGRFAETVKNELEYVGFDIKNRDEDADLLLTEVDLFPFLSANTYKRIIAFCPNGERLEGNIKADRIFPRIFSLEELEGELRNAYFSLTLGENLQYQQKDKAQAKNRGQNENFEVSMPKDGGYAIVCGKKIELSENESAVLRMLIEASESEKTVSRFQLACAIGHAEGESGNIVDVYICRLRQKLEKPFARRFISTARGEGYYISGCGGKIYEK
ncbi:MAG: winged helix-turn-helix transcriptional regulator [Clostridia bacterium]|nr:winged helix-turn-helix transcriptional regulator [Clostridia bacterium]